MKADTNVLNLNGLKAYLLAIYFTQLINYGKKLELLKERKKNVITLKFGHFC